MIQINLSAETPLRPQEVLAAATDFTERRPSIWFGIDPRAYRVHRLDEMSAEVTEGSSVMGGIWARERYDWSTPGLVRAEVQDSNVFRPGSSWELAVRERPDGGTAIDWTSRRSGRGLKGRILVLMLRLQGRKFLSGYLAQVLSRLESQHTS